MFQNVPPCSSNKPNAHHSTSENTMKLKLISITFLIMLLLTPLGQLIYAQDTGDSGTDDDEVDIIDPLVYQQIRNTTRLRYQEFYTLMFNSTPHYDSETETSDGNTTYTGPAIPEDTDPAIRNMFISAWRAMQQGDDEESNPQAAVNAYMRALKQLRNAYRKYETDNPEIIEALNTTDGGGIEEDDIPDEPTEAELTEVRQQLVERFQERFQERLTSMYEIYNNVSDGLSADDSVKALNALTKAEQKLLRIQARIEAHNFTGVVDDLEEAEDEMEDDFDSLNNTAASQMFKTMNKLEERIQKMEEKAARKAAHGEDASEEYALIAQLRGNKDKAKESYLENKGQNNDKSNGNQNKGGNSGN